ncbi:hypothetical protein PYL83_06360 [Moraxella lacunata]|uniref:hypothetical protein n=1 Tax=Moraxella lacunata TaxID=477 RepID=UPI002480C8C9|nr:hypothetical protein [Moraxella lacunata]MDH9218861.1 hypothetical protein [Moraxella lacunata]
MKKSDFTKYSALALMVGMCLQTTHAKDYSQVIFFGDSLSDTGRLKDLVSEQRARWCIWQRLTAVFYHQSQPCMDKSICPKLWQNRQPQHAR